ncbi:nuclear transport factor 2 family protein [Sandaracinus amylolyticus]|uniref:nuclear transport factor 2 family protein n=1 Tax=Sandaracinus amylolyticus TaxID=927083 RepID=UPI001F2994EC|nr:nuclear transport factor 2 family protein [Sandaracinus amylolyticus]UJR86581.1 Hypothetical protein I5071_86820 [Sandaracinus amylolyticus]
MTNVEALVRDYLETWNETDPARRRALFERVYAADAVYVDPHVAAEGREQIEQFVSAVQARYPGVRFTLHGAVDAHHDQARFTWHAAPAGAREPVAIGFDVVVTEQGRMKKVYGFLDKQPG